ncbi:tryptophan--tRNA ligase [Candidatus Gracilibacteria bacterium GN02-873]|jgi:tryptophan--tRNA ligase|nr:tryptophan--tRNA ligase [Candidatus Gracilibacteria bacterium GN02-873]
MKKKIITGVKPTGASMHLGNLMGAVLPFKEIAKNHDSALFIADLHALTSVKDGQMMRNQSLELAIEYFSIFGLDTETIIFRQSDIKNITKLMWILANVTPYSLMLRAHSFKDAEAKNADINMGTFNYPILMAADILGYGIDAVPVGKDQIQHLEMTRDMARAFNKTYQTDIFIEPEAIVSQEVATLPGIDGRKMSKSYDNFIGIFDDEKTLKKRVMSIVTDSRGVDEKKDPETCNVFALLKVFAQPEKLEEIRAKYLSENIGFGYGHAKKELLEILLEYFRPYREAREKLLQNPELVEEKLNAGAKMMNQQLDGLMEKIYQLTGIR